MAFLNSTNLLKLGFASVGENVLISDKSSIYGAAHIHIGDHVRIDDFSVLSAGEGGIHLGSFIHVACYCSLIGRENIRLDDYSGLSARVSIYSSSDDYSGEWMTNPTVASEFTKVTHLPVDIGRHCIVGSGSVILPGVTLGQGVAIGALSLVTKNCAEFGIYSGAPARFLRQRSRDLLTLESQHRAQI